MIALCRHFFHSSAQDVQGIFRNATAQVSKDERCQAGYLSVQTTKYSTNQSLNKSHNIKTEFKLFRNVWLNFQKRAYVLFKIILNTEQANARICKNEEIQLCNSFIILFAKSLTLLPKLPTSQ